MKKTLNYLKEKWGITSTWQIIIINVVFALAGFGVVFIKDHFYALIGVEDAGFWVKFILFFLFFLPMHNILLLFFGFFFGQFKFFWNYEKKFVGRIGRLFSARKSLQESKVLNSKP